MSNNNQNNRVWEEGRRPSQEQIYYSNGLNNNDNNNTNNNNSDQQHYQQQAQHQPQSSSLQYYNQRPTYPSLQEQPPQPQQYEQNLPNNNINQTTPKVGKGKKKATEVNDGEGKVEEGVPRSGRACLACRKLKTRCDNADDPPCRRCRAGNHQCVFVESKRGKRPPKKAIDVSLAEKYRTVEKSISRVLNSMEAGATPDLAALQQLKTTLADEIAADAKAVTGKGPNAGVGSGNGRKINAAAAAAQRRSLSSDEDYGDDRMSKRSRQDSNTSNLSQQHHHQQSHQQHQQQQQQQQFSPTSPLSVSPHSSNLSTHSSIHNPYHPNLHASPSNLQQPLPIAHQPHPGQTSLSILADASLAAEIDGRSQLTGLDPKFTLSSITQAIQDDNIEGIDGGPKERTPGILGKGIIDPETAVELFRIFFDYAYIHLPLIDPAFNSATSLCTRSPFLFTVICAVASRFHPDPELHIACYDEAHICFVECVAEGERSIESVQACMILTVWTNAPKTKEEDRPKRAWMYFGMAVRMGLELGLYRPPAFVDAHLVHNSSKPNPWINLPKDISEEEQRDALNRERTWLLVFVIDRNMSAVMGRPYQIHEAKPLLIPLHPLSLPFDLGVIAHQELQSIIGQVMDTFRERIYGLSSSCDEMPSPVVMKLFNSRMDEWRARWCPVPGEPIANNLLFYFYSSKLFLNTFPLHTMLRRGDAVDDPECVSTTINAAKSILDLGHKYAELGVLRHCPDVNFLLLLYGAVFLIKVKASNTRFAQLVDSEELQTLMLQSIQDCQEATCSSKHAASTCMIMLRALYSSWKTMSAPPTSMGGAAGGGIGSIEGGAGGHSRSYSLNGGTPGEGSTLGLNFGAGGSEGQTSTSETFTNNSGTSTRQSPSVYQYKASPFMAPSSRPPSSFGILQSSIGNGYGGGSGTQTPNGGVETQLDSFLNDTHFFNSVLVSKGADGFFSWMDGLDSAAGMEFDGI